MRFTVEKIGHTGLSSEDIWHTGLSSEDMSYGTLK